MAVVDLRHGDCRTVMASMPAESVDAIVCDPPYGLSFMGKGWDHGVPGVEFWEAALRVLKPGGHLLAFGGTRTFHRLACAIEDAGFEIRDSIAWLYGSGFPKSLDVSKAIDKAAGSERAPGAQSLAPVVGQDDKVTYGKGKGNRLCETCGKWTFATDRCECSKDGGPATEAAQQWQGWGTALKPAFEPIVVARKPLIGTVAANVLAHGIGALNIDGCRIGTDVISTVGPPDGGNKFSAKLAGGKSIPTTTLSQHTGRWPANLIHDGSDEVLAGFPQAKGQQGAVTGREPSATTTNAYGGGYSSRAAMHPHGDTGSAARFFYCAKASKRDRDEGLEGFDLKREADRVSEDGVGGDNPRNRTNKLKLNHHPTVKPTDLMRYLCRLVTPPGGVVLDPFMGSGSTGKAAVLEGFNFTGIELDVEYIEIARARIAHALQSDKQQTLAL